MIKKKRYEAERMVNRCERKKKAEKGKRLPFIFLTSQDFTRHPIFLFCHIFYLLLMSGESVNSPHEHKSHGIITLTFDYTDQVREKEKKKGKKGQRGE